MSRLNNRTYQNGYVMRVARLLQSIGTEEGVRRIVERGAQFEVANKQLKKEIAELKRHEASLRQLAITDDLTGLHNRRGFLTLAKQQLKMAHRNNGGLSVVYIDVDGLKNINDTFGHEAGSAALRDTAEVLRKTFRDSDIIARIGGDEFVVLVMQSSDDGAEAIASRLQREVANHNAHRIHHYELSLSAGQAYLDAKKTFSIEDVMAVADEAMYEHKRSKKLEMAFT